LRQSFNDDFHPKQCFESKTTSSGLDEKKQANRATTAIKSLLFPQQNLMKRRKKRSAKKCQNKPIISISPKRFAPDFFQFEHPLVFQVIGKLFISTMRGNLG